MFSFLNRQINRIPVNWLIGTSVAFFSLIVGTVYLDAAYKRYIVRKSEFYGQSFQILQRNRAALQLLGEPVQVGNVKKVKVDNDNRKVLIEVKITGRQRKGDLCINLNKSEEADADWKLKSVEMKLNKDLEGKTIIIHKE